MTPAKPNAAPLAAAVLMINAFVWGLSWWPLRALQAHGLHPLWATALVYAIVVSAMLVFHFKAWRGLWAYPPLFLMGLSAGLTNLGFNWAVATGDVVRVVLLFYLMPAWSVLVAWLVLNEKPTAGSLLRLALAMAGVLVVLKTPESAWPVPQTQADWLALMGGLSFAVTNALLRKYRQASSASRMLAMFGGSGLMAALVAILGTWTGLVTSLTLNSGIWPIVLLLSVAFLLSNAALQYGAARLAASTTALVMLTEILFASGSSALWGGSQIGGRVLLGGGLIVLAAVLAAVTPAGARKKPHNEPSA